MAKKKKGTWDYNGIATYIRLRSHVKRSSCEHGEFFKKSGQLKKGPHFCFTQKIPGTDIELGRAIRITLSSHIKSGGSINILRIIGYVRRHVLKLSLKYKRSGISIKSLAREISVNPDELYKISGDSLTDESEEDPSHKN